MVAVNLYSKNVKEIIVTSVRGETEKPEREAR